MLPMYQEINVTTNQKLFRQGEKATHVYVVLDGYFELTRERRNFSMLTDPTQGGSLGQSGNVDTHRMAQLLGGPKMLFSKRFSGLDHLWIDGHPSASDYLGGPTMHKNRLPDINVPNNTLRIKPNTMTKTVRGNFIVAHVERGNMMGVEDAINERVHTVTARCASMKATVYAIKTSDFLMKIRKD